MQRATILLPSAAVPQDCTVAAIAEEVKGGFSIFLWETCCSGEPLACRRRSRRWER
ncbi:MAG: hypothetical protein SVX43_05755 [Cyanobacteriota bacterium]|nr:hypothetical protein [Cyanobacteriota bacterium]